MKILYTHRTRGRGAEGVHIMGMVDAFREQGHVVVVDGPAGCDPYEVNGLSEAPRTTPSWLAASQRFVAERTPQVVFGLAELIYNVPALWRLWRQMRAFRPDLVYERYAVGHGAPAWLCRLCGIPRIAEVNDSLVIARSRPSSWQPAKRIIEARALRSASLIVTISQDFKRRLLDAYAALAAEGVLVCPNAVSERRFVRPPPARTDALRRGWRLEGRLVIGSAGQFVAWHGLAQFVSAMAAYVRDANAMLLFIGDGPVRDEVTDAAREAGIEDRVVFTGMVPHAMIPEHLALLDIAVIPFSNAHGSPMKLMEFMAMGLPVVAPDLSPVQEVLEDGRTGYLFRQGDMQDMHRVLARVVEDREAAQAVGDRAKEFVRGHLTWSVHARACLEWYERRLARAPEGRSAAEDHTESTAAEARSGTPSTRDETAHRRFS